MKIPILSGRDVVRALLRNGFTILRTKGSHHFLQNEQGISTVVPVHAGRTMGKGLLKKIVTKDLQMSMEEFLKWL